MKRKLLSGVLCIAMMSTLAWGCGISDEDDTSTEISETTATVTDTNIDELTPVTLNEVAHSVFYAPMYVAIEEGYFSEEGIDLELVTGFGADKTMAALISGEAEIGFMGPETTIYTYQQGSTDIVMNFAQLTQRAGNFLVAREDVSDFSWNDLVGTTVLAGRAGGMPQMVFEYILKENGIDPVNDLEMIQNIDFGATAAAFTGGQGDFTVEFEPSATLLESEGGSYVIASLGVDSGYVPYTAFSATTSYMDENPEIIQGFTNAIQRGIDTCNSATSEEIAVMIAAQFPDMDLITLATIIERYDEQDTWKDELTFEEDAFELLQDILESAGELEGRVEYDALVDTTFTQNIN